MPHVLPELVVVTAGERRRRWRRRAVCQRRRLVRVYRAAVTHPDRGPRACPAARLVNVLLVPLLHVLTPLPRLAAGGCVVTARGLRLEERNRGRHSRKHTAPEAPWRPKERRPKGPRSHIRVTEFAVVERQEHGEGGKVAEARADSLARRCITHVGLRQQRKRPAVNRDVLCRAEEDKSSEEHGQAADVGSVKELADAARAEHHKRRRDKLHRDDPALAAPKARVEAAVHDGTPQQLERVGVRGHGEQADLHSGGSNRRKRARGGGAAGWQSAASRPKRLGGESWQRWVPRFALHTFVRASIHASVCLSSPPPSIHLRVDQGAR
eukprot:359586-Chlamydomonas_euryale.AAC.9